MDITALLIFVGLLFILFIGHNLFRQHQERLVAERKKKIARYSSIINSTDDLLSNIHTISYSRTLLLCLSKRILFALQNMCEIDKNNESYYNRMIEMSKQITHLENGNYIKFNAELKIPASDKQAITMLRLVKTLKVVVKSEYSKGHLPIYDYLNENKRLDVIRMRIHIENLIKRAEKAKNSYQYGTCIQLLQKGIELLELRTDCYSKGACTNLQQMLSEVWETQSKKHEDECQRLIEKDQDLFEAMFEPSKNW